MKLKISISLDEELISKLMAESETTGRSVSNYINKVLLDKLCPTAKENP